MMEVNLLLGGPVDQWPLDFATQIAKKNNKWIGVDRGALRLLKAGRIPDIAIGDFDSLQSEELKQVQAKVKDIRYAIPEKDDTDSELGLKIALEELQAEQVTIYGATGGRLDHFLVNLLMVLEPRFRSVAEKIRMIDHQNVITFFRPGQHEITKLPAMRYLAFIPLTPVDGLTLADEKYTLDHVDFPFARSLASNEFIDETANFSFDSGIVCVIQSKDPN